MERSFRLGDIVFAQGHPIEFVYIIKSGAVQIARRDEPANMSSPSSVRVRCSVKWSRSPAGPMRPVSAQLPI